MTAFNLVLFILISNLLLLTPLRAQSKFTFGLGGSLLVQSIKTTSETTLTGVNSGNPITVMTQTKAQGYSVDLFLQYALCARLSVSTGLGILRMHYQKPTIITVPDLTQNPTQPQVIGVEDANRWYQIPILLNYRVLLKKLSPCLSVGTLLLFHRTVITSSGETYVYTNQVVYAWPTLQAGAIYQVNQSLRLAVQPSFTYIPVMGSFSSYTNYQLGLHVQLQHRL